jgi:hypothetical protein
VRRRGGRASLIIVLPALRSSAARVVRAPPARSEPPARKGLAMLVDRY